MTNNLDPEMQARLDQWRAHPLPVKSLLDIRKKGMFIPRRQNHGDIDTDEEIEIMKRLHNKNIKGEK